MPRKKKSKADKLQMTLPGFGLEKSVDQARAKYEELGKALDEVSTAVPVKHETENEFELCTEIAAAIKRDYRATGLSREAFCDRINEFLGRTPDRYHKRPRLCRKPLSPDMLSKMMTDPIHYPLHAYYLFAFQHVSDGFRVANAILGAKGAKVVSGEDLKKFAQIKAQELRQQAQDLEKSIGRM